MKFRKKPVVIEAFQYGIDPRPDWFDDRVTSNDIVTHWSDESGGRYCTIQTLEGDMIGDYGDYIIQGVKGEIYPCKEEIFLLTYESVTIEPAPDLQIIKNKIVEESKKGNVIVAGIDGLQGMPLVEFIKQPVDGLLYDLNRSEAVVLTFISDPKWVNDYAVAQVIRALKNKIDELTLKL